MRKYSVDEKLALLVKDVMTETVDNIMKNEGINKPFVPYDYIYLTLLNVLAASAFGSRLVQFIIIKYLFLFILINSKISSFSDIHYMILNFSKLKIQ